MIQDGASSVVTSSDKNWAIATHLSVFAGFVVPGIGFFGPLVIWMIKRGESPFLDAQGKEAVNLGFSAMIPLIVILLAELAYAFSIPQLKPDISPLLLMLFPVLASLLILVIGGAWLVFSVLAAVQGSKGKPVRHRYIHQFFN